MRISSMIKELKEAGFTRKQMAYILATVKHETNNTFKPVAEAYWLKNSEEWLRKHHPDYYPYYGRGYVQITWKANYKKFGEILGIDLVRHPELALKEDVALKILIIGFQDGLFTGKKISDYISGDKCDYVGARRCINGSDKAAKIAGYAFEYELGL